MRHAVIRSLGRSALLPLVLLLVGGCAYYNGMYNAKRLAGSAERAEREGRTLDANNFWGQVAVKAESVIARHPSSKWADDALLLRGRALARLNQCENALTPLRQAMQFHGDAQVMEEAIFLLGRCQARLGDAVGANASFARLIDSRDPEVRREARYQYARALTTTGRHADALRILDSLDDPRGARDRMVALLGAGRTSEGLTVAESLLAAGDTAAPWQLALATLGERDPRAASALLDCVRQQLKLPQRTQTAMVLDDGLRLVELDTARGVARLGEAVSGDGEGVEAMRARMAIARLRLAGARMPAQVADVAPSLEAIVSTGGRESPVARQMLDATAAVLSVDSVTAGTPQGDMSVFLAAESARDVLGARALALELFGRVPALWPTSPYAPKALLAGRQLDTTWTVPSQQLLDSVYAASPYLAVLRGEEAPEYQVLEDSLARFARSTRRVAPPNQAATAAASVSSDSAAASDSAEAARAREAQSRQRSGRAVVD